MKKVLILIALLCGITGSAAQAANGDIVGNIYSTDIIAYVNGRQMPSYNVGGRTAIVVEDLEPEGAGYGLSYYYDDYSRKLEINSHGYAGYGEVSVERGTVGRIAGNILETDIEVMFNGIPVTGYNIGGRTAVVIEDLGTVINGAPNSEYGYSEYLCSFNWNEEKREVSLNTFQTNDPRDISVPKIKYHIRDNEMTLSFDQLGYYLGEFDYEISDDFPRNSLQPVYLDGEAVGLIYVTDYDGDIGGFISADRYDLDKIYPKAKAIEKILSYDEAVKFIEKNYIIEDKIEFDNATVYMAKNDEGHNIMYAVKSGGLVLENIYDNNYTTVEFRQNGGWYVYAYPFAGPHGADGMMTPLSPYMYYFSKTYHRNFGGVVVENYDEIKEGDAKITVEGKEYTVSAIKVDGKIYVDADETADVCGIDYRYFLGKFIFNTHKLKKDISIELISERVQNENAQVSYLNEKTLIIDGENNGEIDAYIYELNNCYVSADFYTGLFSSEE